MARSLLNGPKLRTGEKVPSRHGRVLSWHRPDRWERSRGAAVAFYRNQREHNMPIFHFHVDNGEFTPDPDGIELPDLTAARREAVRAAGAIINESNESFWEHMTPWIMNVTDGEDRLLFTLQFAAKVPSGLARYIPSTNEPTEPGST